MSRKKKKPGLVAGWAKRRDAKKAAKAKAPGRPRVKGIDELYVQFQMGRQDAYTLLKPLPDSLDAGLVAPAPPQPTIDEMMGRGEKKPEKAKEEKAKGEEEKAPKKSLRRSILGYLLPQKPEKQQAKDRPRGM